MKKHWYTVTLEYKSEGVKLFSFTFQVGLIDQADILKPRQLKKATVEKFIGRNPEVRGMLCNGSFSLVPVAYLGRFKDEGGTLKQFLEAIFGDRS